MTGAFRPGEVAKVKELREKTGLSLREAMDLLRRHDGDLGRALADAGPQPWAYVSPEQKVRDVIKDFYKALQGGQVDEISARIKLSSLVEEAMGMSFDSWSKQQGV